MGAAKPAYPAHAEATARATGNIKRATAAMRTFNTAFNALTGAITGANEESELRKKPVQRLKKGYPQHIKHIDAEKASNGELPAVLRNVNAECERKYTVAACKGKSNAEGKKVGSAKSPPD